MRRGMWVPRRFPYRRLWGLGSDIKMEGSPSRRQRFERAGEVTVNVEVGVCGSHLRKGRSQKEVWRGCWILHHIHESHLPIWRPTSDSVAQTTSSLLYLSGSDPCFISLPLLLPTTHTFPQAHLSLCGHLDRLLQSARPSFGQLFHP